uniref:Small ribosomal subunit protein mS38 n=2 Tax=Oryza brachyantha TaxID=4533 RepID=J3LRG9_ORYBR
AAPPCPGTIPTQAPPSPNLRELLSSFHPGLQIFPSLDPRVGRGCEGVDANGNGGGAEVWADSVKKKRKRKMNKHKLRKLRKRLRRQT